MIKNFVLDTNVLPHDPTAIFEFEDNRKESHKQKRGFE